MKDIKTVIIQGGYYTVVAIQFDLFESKIIDEKHFATLEEAEQYKRETDNNNVSCIIGYME